MPGGNNLPACGVRIADRSVAACLHSGKTISGQYFASLFGDRRRQQLQLIVCFAMGALFLINFVAHFQPSPSGLWLPNRNEAVQVTQKTWIQW